MFDCGEIELTNLSRALAASTIAIILHSQAKAQQPAMHIPRSQIETMFSAMRTNTKWNVDGDLIWSYYFTDASKSDLYNATATLEKQGYKFVDIHVVEAGVGGVPDIWGLHVDRIEHHTTDSLVERDEQLYALAGTFPAMTYDGMEAGPAN